MKLEIDNTNVSKSFDQIASELLNRKVLRVNKDEFRLTEIEFYYFHPTHHPDEYTHSHKREAGEWRFHNQGIDITFQGNEVQDGGILIRGVAINDEYTNGPINALKRIFESFGSVSAKTIVSLHDCVPRDLEIIKTFRHLPNKVTHRDFHLNHYRYLVNLEKLRISNTLKKEIQDNCASLK
ncbi:hypothetical protein [Algoriphagus sediminis]|uniref:Uncharacterized protein n=1 Tax=Algoriphagus sediminis TaxID=3057113 RepID=A0ABT7YGE1_9BACT|nr:hypothetical protein [Algoriphagus sediminis]MDN3205591.1 hypothetical protein [Algoriphagus sediminis]